MPPEGDRKVPVLLVARGRERNTMSGKPKTPKIEEIDSLEGMRRVYVQGSRPDLKIPFREIELQSTRLPDGKLQPNDPVRVYDTSGPWGDPDFHGDVRQGLPATRASGLRKEGTRSLMRGEWSDRKTTVIGTGTGISQSSFPVSVASPSGPSKDLFRNSTMPARG
jgi:hypothetical protein